MCLAASQVWSLVLHRAGRVCASPVVGPLVGILTAGGTGKWLADFLFAENALLIFDLNFVNMLDFLLSGFRPSCFLVVFPLTDLACFAVSLGASKLPVRPAVLPLLTLWLDIVAGLQLFL